MNWIRGTLKSWSLLIFRLCNLGSDFRRRKTRREKKNFRICSVKGVRVASVFVSSFFFFLPGGDPKVKPQNWKWHFFSWHKIAAAASWRRRRSKEQQEDSRPTCFGDLVSDELVLLLVVTWSSAGSTIHTRKWFLIVGAEATQRVRKDGQGTCLAVQPVPAGLREKPESQRCQPGPDCRAAAPADGDSGHGLRRGERVNSLLPGFTLRRN